MRAHDRLGGISSFSSASERSAQDWIVASWCLALLLTLVGWWMAGWVILRGRTEIEFVTLFLWIVATSFLYLAAAVLVPSTPIWEVSDRKTKPTHSARSSTSISPRTSEQYFYIFWLNRFSRSET
jgi:hypothetical protein